MADAQQHMRQHHVAPQPIAHQDDPPQSVQIVLNPARDTYLAENQARSWGTSNELRIGFWPERSLGPLVEHRAYLYFPLDPTLHPASGLELAELWLHPRRLPRIFGATVSYTIRTLLEPFDDNSAYPPWIESDMPSSPASIVIEPIDWKRITVTTLVSYALRDPRGYHGWEIAGTNFHFSPRFDFVSSEGGAPYPDGIQPRLVMTFSARAFATAPPDDTATPTATDTPTVTNTPEFDHPTAAAATATATATSEREVPRRLYLPRTLRQP